MLRYVSRHKACAPSLLKEVEVKGALNAPLSFEEQGRAHAGTQRASSQGPGGGCSQFAARGAPALAAAAGEQPWTVCA